MSQPLSSHRGRPSRSPDPGSASGRPSPTPPESQSGIPQAVRTMLGRAKAAERAASSGQRVEALRITRQLLTGAYQAGYSSRDLADCLGVSTQSVRNRLDANQWLPLSAVIAFIEVDPLFLHRLRALATDVRTTPDGTAAYSSVDIVRAVASSPIPAQFVGEPAPAEVRRRRHEPPPSRRLPAPRPPRFPEPSPTDRLSLDRVQRAMNEVPGP